jgi:pheromone shutdown-related protein TraB
VPRTLAARAVPRFDSLMMVHHACHRVRVDLPGITLVGTSHVSQGSVDEVRAVIRETKPAVVAVELDAHRLRALTERDKYDATPITEVVRSGRSAFVLAQSLLASYQRRIGAAKGVEPGAEMIAAIEGAKEIQASLVLADRDIGITLRRAYASTGIREKTRISWELLKALVGVEEEDVIDPDDLLQEDVLTAMMEDLAKVAPSVTRVLIRERDAYLAAKIRDAARSGPVVAVVGAGHLKGIEQYLRAPQSIPDPGPLEKIERKGLPWGTILSTAIALVIAGFFAYQAYVAVTTGSYTDFCITLLDYVIATAFFTGLGAALAGGNPLAVATGMVAAPLKPLHFFVGSGIFPGLVQAHIHKPTVGDLQGVSKIERAVDLYRNKATHVLLVTSLAQVGADVGFYLAFPLAVHFGIPGVPYLAHFVPGCR